eukprot:scaffold37129_cov21-Prasinocladus_malaysianus.AAC.2
MGYAVSQYWPVIVWLAAYGGTKLVLEAWTKYSSAVVPLVWEWPVAGRSMCLRHSRLDKFPGAIATVIHW